MPLTLAAVGEDNTIQRIAGKPEVKKHLENLGFVVRGRCKSLNCRWRECHRQGKRSQDRN